jgi:hypothetical protein
MQTFPIPALLLALGAVPASAQALMGAESALLAGATLDASGQSAVSLSYRLQAALLGVDAGELASATYELRLGWTGMLPGLPPAAPIVLGVGNSYGGAVGGESRRVYGHGLATPAGGIPLVEFGGATAAYGSAVSAACVEVTTPTGYGTAGNPKGPVDVRVTTATGSSTRAAAFAFGPALTLDASALVGGKLDLRLRCAPGSFALLAVGQAAPGISFAIAPFAGALELVAGTQALTGLKPALQGELAYALQVPDDAAVAGIALHFQALALTSLVTPAGSFTNTLKVTLLP